MFLNRSVQKPHLKLATKFSTTSPDYVGLVKFLLQSFLDSPESLSIDCEVYNTEKRAWIRIAFENTDKGKVFGRGGRNIQAIRTVIAAAAKMAGQYVYLDIYGSNDHEEEEDSVNEDFQQQVPRPRLRERPENGYQPILKPRLR